MNQDDIVRSLVDELELELVLLSDSLPGSVVLLTLGCWMPQSTQSCAALDKLQNIWHSARTVALPTFFLQSLLHLQRFPCNNFTMRLGFFHLLLRVIHSHHQRFLLETFARLQ